LRSKVVSICDYKPTKASNLRSIMSRVYLAVDAKTANTYGAAMDFAEIKGIKPNQLLKFLKKENGVHKCAKKFRELVSKKTTAAKSAVGRRAVRGRRGRRQDSGGSGSAGPWRGGAVSSGLGFRAI
jgi:hypothetical protein